MLYETRCLSTSEVADPGRHGVVSEALGTMSLSLVGWRPSLLVTQNVFFIICLFFVMDSDLRVRFSTSCAQLMWQPPIYLCHETKKEFCIKFTYCILSACPTLKALVTGNVNVHISERKAVSGINFTHYWPFGSSKR